LTIARYQRFQTGQRGFDIGNTPLEEVLEFNSFPTQGRRPFTIFLNPAQILAKDGQQITFRL
jgi:hypothetical protein